jgi:galactofuranose transport system ATP-binding protein
MSLAPDVILHAHSLTKRFPGVVALDDVQFTLRRGEVHALMGENGAGKSTLIKVITGVYPKDSGTIELDRHQIHPRSPKDADNVGIRTVYQEVNLVPDLSVAENLLIGRFPKFGPMIRWGKVRSMARAAMKNVGVDIDVTRSVRSHSIAIQQMVAIARAVMEDDRRVPTKVLVLDEPTSSLDAAEVDQLFRVVELLKARGVAIVFVTHFMDQVYRISDRITVLRNGRLVGEWLAKDLPRLELVSQMMGKNLAEVAAMNEHRPATSGASTGVGGIEVKNLGRAGKVSPVSFPIRPGEAVGLAGLLGSGRTEVARLLYGIDRPDTGTLTLDGEAVDPNSPRKMIILGFGMTPEDRKADGIVPSLSVRENILLGLQSRRGLLRKIPTREQYALAHEYIKKLNIKTPHADQPIRNLSGGNQQKCLLARWLITRPRLLILDEPTRGIDVGAKAEIEKLVGELCQTGMSVLFISSELEEVVRTCARVIVMRDREQVGTLEGKDVEIAGIMKTIAQHQPLAASPLSQVPPR